MKMLVAWVIGTCCAGVGLADTVHLKNRGAEINGTVTFANGVFRIEAQFKKAKREISVGRDEVDELRINDVVANPDEDAPGWMLTLPRSARSQAGDTIRFWDEKRKEITGTLGNITEKQITLAGQKAFDRTDVRSVIMH
jgi:hypothetical protein